MKTKKPLTFFLMAILLISTSACNTETTDSKTDASVTEGSTTGSTTGSTASTIVSSTGDAESVEETKVFDYYDEGELFFDYPASYSHSDASGMDTFRNPDETITVRIHADINENDVNNTVEYFESHKTYEEFRQEDLTIAGYEAFRIYFIGDWGDYEMNTVIKLSDEAGYNGAKFYVDTRDETLLSSPEVNAIIESIRVAK